MALQIYLPLNGDTKNYGLASNVTITTNNIAFNANGKIGQCGQFNGSDSFISINSQALNNCFKGGSQAVTIAFWVKHSDTNRAIIFGDYGLTGAIGFNLELKASSTSDWRWYWNGSPDQSLGSNVAPADGNWHHCAVIYNGTTLKAYKDGILVGSVVTLTLSTKNKTTGLWYIGRDNRTGATAFNGYLNDFRIYNHALKESELKRLVKAPILHYQLNQFDNYLIRTYHMSGGGTASGNTKTYLENNEVVQVVAASGNSNYVKFDHANEAFKLTNFLNAGDKFTISYDIKIVSANNKLPQVYATNNSGGYQSTTGDPTLVGEWQRVQCIKTQGSATDGGISVHIGFSGCVGTYLIRHLKLEPGEVTRTYWTPNLRDLEGNIHNGYGNPELKSSINTLAKFGQGNHKSPRYKSALLFGAHQTPYTIADFTNIKAALGNCTISWWEKVTITGNSLPFTGGNTQYYVGAGSTTKDLYDGTNSGANAWIYVDGVKETSPSGTTTRTHTGIKYEQNVWHHYCLVNVNMTNWTKFWIDNYGSSWPTQAYLSDLRIYNSLLTDAEVLELYQMGHVA